MQVCSRMLCIFFLGDCNCANVASKPVYLRPGQTTVVVTWENPSLKCKNNRTPNTVSTVVSPNVASPHSFGVGQHKINYTFTFKDGFDIQCSVDINVTCKCAPLSN